MEEAGFPEGVFNVITGYGAEAGEALVTHPDVAKIAFTGGSKSGTHVYERAAAGLKKVSLELGGKSPNIVFGDCNIENAVKGAISGIFAATGQTCIAGSRLLVQENIHDEFVDKLVDFAKTAQMGDPMSMDTQVGPVTTIPQYEKILGYMDVAKEDGAECVMGGTKADRPECGDGWFVEPTVYTGVNNKMRIAQEEVFGPVLSVIPFKDDEEAIEIANDVEFGLAAGVWTSDIRRAPSRCRSGFRLAPCGLTPIGLSALSPPSEVIRNRAWAVKVDRQPSRIGCRRRRSGFPPRRKRQTRSCCVELSGRS